MVFPEGSADQFQPVGTLTLQTSHSVLEQLPTSNVGPGGGQSSTPTKQHVIPSHRFTSTAPQQPPGPGAPLHHRDRLDHTTPGAQSWNLTGPHSKANAPHVRSREHRKNWDPPLLLGGPGPHCPNRPTLRALRTLTVSRVDCRVRTVHFGLSRVDVSVSHVDCLLCALALCDRTLTDSGDIPPCGIRGTMCSYSVCTECATDLGRYSWDRSIGRWHGIADL